MTAEYWIWLQQVLGYSSCAVSRVISEYKTAKAFYNADNDEKIKRCRLSKAQVDRLNKIPRKTVYNILNECKNTGIKIITPEDSEYPERLLNIPDPPAVLYLKGNWSDFNNLPMIAIVGPRKISEYGDKCAYVIASTLSSCGFVIVSGGALGGDSSAHLGAVDEGKYTVGVLGSGINSDYLKANEDLRNRITENGCLISEYPPFFPASRFTFPQRNRIVSGISNGIVVVEGGVKSGTLITARYAVDQGKEVFVIPGSPSEDCYEGSNKLISDGAKPLLNINDIISEYYQLYKDKLVLPEAENKLPKKSGLSNIIMKSKSIGKIVDKLKPSAKKASSVADTIGLSPNSREAYETALRIGESFTPDDIVEQSSLSIEEVLSSITELEILSLIQIESGGRYCVKFQ